MNISPTGIKLIKSFEGLSLTSYVCPVGVLTIGYGHTGNVLAGTKITEKEADSLLKQDLTGDFCPGNNITGVTIANGKHTNRADVAGES